MKTIIFAAVLSAAGIMSANAQETVDISANYGGINFLPSYLTTNGKPAPVGINVDEQDNMTASIMDTDMKVVKQFKIKKPVAVRHYYIETAIVKPSGAEESYYYNEKVLQYTGAQVIATDMNSLIKRMSEIYVGYKFYGFTDLRGNVSCYCPDLTEFFCPNCLGTAYPYDYFSIIDGIIYRIHESYNPTFSQEDLDNAEWSKDETYSEQNICFSPIIATTYYNCDTNIFYDRDIFVSQALFNEDDKWEYILPQYGPVKKTVREPHIDEFVETGVRVSRETYEEPEGLGFCIYDEDGNVIASFDAPDTGQCNVFVSNGNTYLTAEGSHPVVCFKYDRATSSVKEISRSKSNAPIISMNGRRITVGADGNNIDEAVLYDMGGRSIASSRRTNGDNITINAANVAQGVYNVALKNKGRIAGAQKIIIK